MFRKTSIFSSVKYSSPARINTYIYSHNLGDSILCKETALFFSNISKCSFVFEKLCRNKNKTKFDLEMALRLNNDGIGRKNYQLV